MDCFYASVEMREYPQHKGKALAVGGHSGRGVLTTCNYIARDFGVRSAMPVFKAKQICPDLICLPVRMKLYREESIKVRAILEKEFSTVEMASIDEAYLEKDLDPEDALAFAVEIRKKIYDQLRLPCSIGIAPNKMLAKIGSGHCKPDNQMIIREEEIMSFMKELPIRAIPGVGPKTQERFRKLGVEKCSNLWRFSMDELNASFGVWGAALYDRSRGVDERKINTSRERKSLSVERTFLESVESEAELLQKVDKIFPEFQERLGKYLKANEVSVQKVYVVLKFSDFQRTTLEITSQQIYLEQMKELVQKAFQRSNKAVRLLGLGARFKTASSRPRNPRQLRLL